MKIWINFEEKDIKKRKNNWKEGDDFKGQLIFEEKQDLENCNIIFKKYGGKVFINFNNGHLEMTRQEFGGLFI